jgi:hypothetical protein
LFLPGLDPQGPLADVAGQGLHELGIEFGGVFEPTERIAGQGTAIRLNGINKLNSFFMNLLLETVRLVKARGRRGMTG